MLDYSKEVTEILEELLHGIHKELSNNLIGVYLRGSLAYGDFKAETSDIDTLGVTKQTVSDVEFSQLWKFHKHIANLPNTYAQRIEIAYIDRKSIRKFQSGRKYPTLEQGECQNLEWSEHRENWILERWVVRECGKTLYGPNPRTLIDPIAPDEIIQAVCARLRDWAEWARDEDDPDWQLPRSHKVYVIETMCRALYTLENGGLSSKPQSVAWALENLSEPWRELVECSQQWREDSTRDLSVNPEIRRFVLWVASSKRCAT